MHRKHQDEFGVLYVTAQHYLFISYPQTLKDHFVWSWCNCVRSEVPQVRVAPFKWIHMNLHLQLWLLSTLLFLATRTCHTLWWSHHLDWSSLCVSLVVINWAFWASVKKWQRSTSVQMHWLTLCTSWHSFIHSDYFYSASSSPLLLRIAPDTARILCRSSTLKCNRQLRVKDLP